MSLQNAQEPLRLLRDDTKSCRKESLVNDRRNSPAVPAQSRRERFPRTAQPGKPFVTKALLLDKPAQLGRLSSVV